MAVRWGGPLPGSVVPPHTLAERRKRALLSLGFPPLTPLVAACVKRTLPFGGSFLLFLVLWLAAHKVRALHVLFPRPCLSPIGAPCPLGVLGAFPDPLGARGGWVSRRLLRRQ